MGVIFTVYEENSSRNVSDYLIQCQGEYSNQTSFYALKDAGIFISTYRNDSLYDSLTQADKIIIRNKCDISLQEAEIITDKLLTYINQRAESGDTQLQIQKYIDTNLKPYSITPVTIVIGGWINVFTYSIIALIIISLLAEILRRIFYYIVLGKINPAKK